MYSTKDQTIEWGQQILFMNYASDRGINKIGGNAHIALRMSLRYAWFRYFEQTKGGGG